MQVKEPPLVLDMNSLHNKRRLMAKIGSLSGLWEFQMRRRKKTRSLNANAYYWSAYIPGWLEWLREASGEPWITAEQAHIVLKKHVLGSKPIVNKETGEVMDEVAPDTHDMDTGEFAEYLDRAAEFLASFCGIVVIPSEMYFEEKDKQYVNVNRDSTKRDSVAA